MSVDVCFRGKFSLEFVTKNAPQNVFMALLCLLLFMKNLFLLHQQLVVVLVARIFLVRILEVLIRLRRHSGRRRFHLYWIFPCRAESWFEIHLRQRHFPETLFRGNMRVGRESFNDLLRLLRGYVQRENTRFRDCIPPEKVLAIGLYWIAHGGSYDNTALAMNVGKTTVREASRDIVDSMTSETT